METPNISDFEIQALIDNELNWEEEKRVRAYIRSNPEANKRYKELSRQKNLLQRWWGESKISN